MQGEPSFLARVCFSANVFTQQHRYHGNSLGLPGSRSGWVHTNRWADRQRKSPWGHQFPAEVGLPAHACFPKGKVFSAVTAGFRGAIAGRGSVSLSLEAPAFMEPATDTYLLEPSLSPLVGIFRPTYGLWLGLGKFFLGELILAHLGWALWGHSGQGAMSARERERQPS